MWLSLGSRTAIFALVIAHFGCTLAHMSLTCPFCHPHWCSDYFSYSDCSCCDRPMWFWRRDWWRWRHAFTTCIFAAADVARLNGSTQWDWHEHQWSGGKREIHPRFSGSATRIIDRRWSSARRRCSACDTSSIAGDVDLIVWRTDTVSGTDKLWTECSNTLQRVLACQ